jgi:CBS domain containing-hemolysin-like protein
MFHPLFMYKVGEVCTPSDDLVSVALEDSLEECLEALSSNKFRHLLVRKHKKVKCEYLSPVLV